MKKNVVITGLVLALVAATGASAATHYLITSTHQIKPSVLRQLRAPQGVTQVKEFRSSQLTLQDGQSSDDVGGMDWEADCPAGWRVVGTGFDDGGIGQVGFVESFDFFVGGIIFNYNGQGIPIKVDLEAICGKVSGAGAIATKAGALTTYHALLRGAEKPRVQHTRAVAASCTYGRINGTVKCLRAGEFCTHSADRQYRHYGFRCIRYYPNVRRYRLTRA